MGLQLFKSKRVVVATSVLAVLIILAVNTVLIYKIVTPLGARVSYVVDVNSDKTVKDFVTGFETLSMPIIADDLRVLSGNSLDFRIPVISGKKIVSLDLNIEYYDSGIETMQWACSKENELEYKLLYDESLRGSVSEEVLSQGGVFLISKSAEDQSIENFLASSVDSPLTKPTILSINYPLKYVTDTEQSYLESLGESVELESALRGSFAFWTYIDIPKTLLLNIESVDLNWSEGADDLTIFVYDLNGEKVSEVKVEDDGINNIDKRLVKRYGHEVEIDLEVSGAYKIYFATNQDRVTQKIELFGSSKMVFDSQIFLADNKEYPFAFENKGVKLYTVADNLSTTTYHKSNEQIIKLTGGLELPVKHNEWNNRSIPTEVIASNDLMQLDIPKNDILLAMNAPFSFTQEAYFEVYKNAFKRYAKGDVMHQYNYIIGDLPALKHIEGDIYEMSYTYPFEGEYDISSGSLGCKMLFLSDAESKSSKELIIKNIRVDLNYE